MINDPLEVDKAVAERIRRRRVRLGLSQKEVAEHIGVSYQQVQKYEKGVCRIGAGTLQRLSTILKTQPSDFFCDPLVETPAKPHSIESRPLSAMERQLLDDFSEIRDPDIRANILHLISSMIANRKYRRHKRIVPCQREYRVVEHSLGEFEGEILNISKSGAAIKSDLTPSISAGVTIGNTKASVVRVFDGGFAVEFVNPIAEELLSEEVVL